MGERDDLEQAQQDFVAAGLRDCHVDEQVMYRQTYWNTDAFGKLYAIDEEEKIQKSTLNPLEIVFPDDYLCTTENQEEYIEFEVILDSGAGAHVVGPAMIPGYKIEESDLSRAGAGFVAADGGRLANLGKALLHLMTMDSQGGVHKVHSTFQVADVTRALWSVALICDSGMDVKFEKTRALILDQAGREICVFQRRNGLYVAKAKLRNPLFQGFQRQGA